MLKSYLILIFLCTRISFITQKKPTQIKIVAAGRRVLLNKGPLKSFKK